MLTCRYCKKEFSGKLIVEGVRHNLHRRTACFECVPFGKREELIKLKYAQLVDPRTGDKRCARCKTDLPLSEFYFTEKLRGRVYHAYCKNCQNKDSVQRIKQQKKEAVAQKGGKCIVCGYDKCIDALEFHHRVPEQKEFEIGGRRLKTERILKELEKCDLLCCRCHREVHSTMGVSLSG